MENLVSLRMSLSTTCNACKPDSLGHHTWGEECLLRDNTKLRINGTLDYCQCYSPNLSRWLMVLIYKAWARQSFGTALLGISKTTSNLFDVFGGKGSVKELSFTMSSQ